MFHMKEQKMDAKERVITTLDGGMADRVPISFSANAGIFNKLVGHFGIDPTDTEKREALLQKLHVDFRSINPRYNGPRLHPEHPDSTIRISPDWGIHTRWVAHGTGGYEDFCDFPLKDLDYDRAANYPMPSPDSYDYSCVPALCKKYEQYAIVTGGAGSVDILNGIGRLTGMEKVFIGLAMEDPALLHLIDRYIHVHFETLRRTIEVADGKIDILWIGEDLGTQRGPIISLDMYRNYIRPHHEKFVQLAKTYGLKVIIHSCGSSSWAFDDFIEMGIDAVETLQPEAANMEPAYLKKTFGDSLVFHGCISTAGPLAFGTKEDTMENCKNVLDIMMPDGGYCFAPTHAIQDNTPLENVLAMYETAIEYGKY